MYMYKIITNLLIPGQTEFPCTFPCDWINKTFALYRNRSNSIESVTSMTFNDDGTTGTIFSTVKMQCFQISEQFLVIRNTRYRYTEYTVVLSKIHMLSLLILEEVVWVHMKQLSIQIKFCKRKPIMFSKGFCWGGIVGIAGKGLKRCLLILAIDLDNYTF